MIVSAPDNRLSFVKELDLSYNGELYPLTDYDIHNVGVVCDSICGDGGDQVILGPSSLVTLLLGSVVGAIASLDQRIRSQSEAMHKSLKPGDNVMLDGKYGEFLGVGSYEGGTYRLEPKLKIKFAQDMILGINIDQAWRLVKATPSRRRLDRYDKQVEQSTAPLFVLKNLLKFPRHQIPPVLKVKLPVVMAKRHVMEHYPNLSIGGFECAAVLPAAYFTQENRYERIGKDPLGREPVICFASELEVAAAITRNQPGAAGLLVGDPRKLKGNLSRIRDLQGIGKPTVVVSEVPRIETEDLGKLAVLGFHIQSWTPSAIKKAYRPTKMILERTQADPFVRRDKILRNAARAASSIVAVESPIGEHLGLVLEKMHFLSKHMTQSNDFRHFFGIAYSFLMGRICLPLPLEQIKLLGHGYDVYLEQLHRLFVLLYTRASPEAALLLQKIFQGILDCCENHKNFHPKHEVFRESVEQLKAQDCVITRNAVEARILTRWLGPSRDVRVFSLQQALKSDKSVRNCLTLGWYGRSHAKLRYSGFCERDTVIGYSFERERKNTGLKHMQRQLKQLSSAAKPSVTGESLEAAFDFEEVMRKLMSHWELSLPVQDLEDVENSQAVDGIPVMFEEDYVAVLAPGYNCRCLDEDKERIVVKKVSEIRRGDLLVFVKDSSDDIFDKLTDAIKERSPRLLQQVCLSQLWKRVLVDYFETNQVSLKAFQKCLRGLGVKRTLSAIRAWSGEDCIGPEDDALKAIAHIVNDAELTERLEDVIRACRRIRALHITLGRYLAKAIVSSAVSGASFGDDQVLTEVADDLSFYAEVVTVLEIGSEFVKVPSGQVNRLLDKFLGM